MSHHSIDRRDFLRATGAATAVAGLAGCVGGGDGDGDSLRLGALYPFSGNLAELGQESFRGTELAVQQRNEDGGVDGMEIEIADVDAPNADDGVSAVENLATTEEVPVTVGSYSSTISRASTQRAAQYDLPYWELGAIADVITQDNPGNVFRTCAPARFFGRDGIDLAANVIAPALDTDVSELRLAVMYESGEYGNAVGEAARNAAEELNMEIVEDLEYEADTSDLSAEIQRLDQADVDVLNHTGYDPDIDLLWDQLGNLDVFIPAVVGNGAGYSLQSFRENVGDEATLGVFNEDFTQYNTDPDFAPGIADFVELYGDEYDEVPRSGHSLCNYFGANVLFDCIEMADSLDLEDMRAAALEMDRPLNEGATSWGVDFDEETMQNTRISVVGHQWQADDYEDDIWRAERADGTPDIYSIFPEEARLDRIEVDLIPQPDYT